MEEGQWFILADGLVRGPFTMEQVEAGISNHNNPLIWGRGQNDWVTPLKWRKWLQEFAVRAEKAKEAASRMWKLKIAGQEGRPMSHDQMIEVLKSRGDISDVEVWTEGFAEWQPVYEIHKIMDELGVSRRAHPRVPIMGTIIFESSKGSFEGRALSISEGGFGATEVEGAKIGERFKVIIKSPNLYAPIHASAEVVFVGQDGYIGMKFTGIQTESKSAIIEYVRKFADEKTVIG